jgi:hypothetical protein
MEMKQARIKQLMQQDLPSSPKEGVPAQGYLLKLQKSEIFSPENITVEAGGISKISNKQISKPTPQSQRNTFVENNPQILTFDSKGSRTQRLKESPKDRIKQTVQEMIEKAEADAERAKRWVSKKKPPPSFLEKSETLLNSFKARDTAANVKRLKMELQAFEPSGGGKSGFSFTLALMQVRKEIQEREQEKIL